MNSAAPPPRTALVAGATGLVGRALLTLLEANHAYAGVHVLVRRPVTGIEANPKVAFHTVDFAHLPHPFPVADDVYIALGTTIKVAGSQEAFRHVDHDYVVNTARAARRAGAKRLAVVSALGADARSRVFYNRVKGQMQQDIVELGYESVVIAQPSLLTGDRTVLGQPTRSGEVWATRLLGPVMGWMPKGIRPISAGVVAEGLVDATLAGAPGTHVLSSAQMQAHHQR